MPGVDWFSLSSEKLQLILYYFSLRNQIKKEFKLCIDFFPTVGSNTFVVKILHLNTLSINREKHYKVSALEINSEFNYLLRFRFNIKEVNSNL